MQLHFNLLVICSVIILSLLDSGDAYRRCSRGYTCYKPQQWKTTHYRACGWMWRSRCTRYVTYFNKYIKSTCHRPCRVKGGWSSWSPWRKYGPCSASCRKYGSYSYPRQQYYQQRLCNNPRPRHGGRYCRGSSRRYKFFKCNTHYCRNYEWGSWSSWRKSGSCSASCRKYRSYKYPQQKYYKRRSCKYTRRHGGRRHRGKRCRGPSRQYKYVKCNTRFCRKKRLTDDF